MASDPPTIRNLSPIVILVRTLVSLVAVAVLVATGPACGPKEPEILPTTIGADRLLFERGTAALEEGDWIRAREYFAEIRDNYPQSPLRADARLAVGDTYLGQGSAVSYVMAEAEFQDYLKLFPTSERADYAQFKLGVVHFQQMRGPQRDQSSTRNSVREFQLLIQRYPDSDFVAEAREHLREARDRLSESEYVVGHYYYRQKWWPGAIERFRLILDTDPAFAGRDRVYYHLGDALREEGEPEEALIYLERVADEFPESEFAPAAADSAGAARIDVETKGEDEDPNAADSGDDNADQSSSPSDATADEPL